MAAYGALLSVVHIIDQIENHPFLPFSLSKTQVESLTEKLTFLQQFLEDYSLQSDETDTLEYRIADAAYAIEDIIESHTVDQIAAEFTCYWKKPSSCKTYRDLQRVIHDLDFIKMEAMKIKGKKGIQDPLRRNSSISAGSVRSSPTGKNSTMVGFDDVLYEMIDKLVVGGQSDRQIISISGMGGIGKTTLARNIYENLVVVQHFDILSWVTISHEYMVKEVFLELYLCVESEGRREILSEMSENELGEMLHKSLSKRRYLIVMDDIWCIDVWDKVQTFFPDYHNGSRIMITTRLSNLACQLSGSRGIEMNFLDENTGWDLLRKNVFGRQSCPVELEEIGKQIVRNCKGLPLSIVVIGGLLAKSQRTREYWEYIAGNLNSIVSLEENQHCFEILYTSYRQLPIHLKPCFLYMGVFQEDSEIRVSELIKLWVAEGFLKPIGGKILEEVAEEYLNELVDRNLILVHARSSNGKIKFCKVHDLLRDLCLREANKYKFLCVMQQNPRGRIAHRRIAIRQSTSLEESLSRVSHDQECWSFARSLIWGHNASVAPSSVPFSVSKQFSQPSNFRLLRVFKELDRRYEFVREERYTWYFHDTVFELFNMRYLSYPISFIPDSIYCLWNLQTLIARDTRATAPPELWKMPLLRHLEFAKITLPRVSVGRRREAFVLGNLLTLFTISIWDCNKMVFERMPNLKKLEIHQEPYETGSIHRLNNLAYLYKLESLNCILTEEGIRNGLLQNLTLPHSLKKLTLEGSRLHWEDMSTRIGSLPFLEVLKLKWHSFIGPEWETIEGDFCNLKYLLIVGCSELKYWNTESTHFPRLEHLELQCLKELEEIPSDIGEIPTLQSIKLIGCSYSAVLSAKRIQEEFGNEGLQVRVEVSKYDKVAESIASPNFQVKVWNSVL